MGLARPLSLCCGAQALSPTPHGVGRPLLRPQQTPPLLHTGQFRTRPLCPPPSKHSPQPRGAWRRRRSSSPLVGVGFAFLPHVVGCGLAEVQPPHGDLGDLLWRQVDPGGWKTEERVRTSLERRFLGERSSPALPHQGRLTNRAQSGGGCKEKKMLLGEMEETTESVTPAAPSRDRQLSRSPPSPALAHPQQHLPTGADPRQHSRDGVEGPFAAVGLRLLDVDRLVQGL